LLNDKQVGGICGTLLTNLSAWLSGAWIDLNLLGGAVKKIAYLLPFAHAVDAGKAAIAGDYTSILSHLLWVIGYAVVILVIAIVVFRHKINNMSK
jgi:ABC-2 type transport system permease protein